MMAPAPTRRRYRVLAWSGAAIVLVSSLAPPMMAAEAPPGLDKLVHAAVYGLLMFCFGRAYARPHWVRAAVLLTCYGGFIEYLQHFSPGRSASLADGLANLVGISIMLATLIRAERDLPV